VYKTVKRLLALPYLPADKIVTSFKSLFRPRCDFQEARFVACGRWRSVRRGCCRVQGSTTWRDC